MRGDASAQAWALQLWRHAAPAQGNVALSPASLRVALDMTRAGARGRTRAELSQVLCLPDDAVQRVPAALRQWLDAAESPAVAVRFANRIYGDLSVPLRQAFVEVSLARWDAAVERLDIRSDPEAARQTINTWVLERTERHVRDLIPEGGVDRQTRMALVNALYFAAQWQTPFSEARTTAADFHVDGTRVASVPTMAHTGFFQCVDAGSHEAVRLLYAGARFALTLLVPKERAELLALERAVDLRVLGRLDAPDTMERLDLRLPRFRLSAPSLNVADALKEMGAKLPFDPEHADFTEMSDPVDPADRLVIGPVYHQASVEVDEQGTVAAAGSAVLMLRAGSARAAAPRVLAVDRPFLFVVEDVATHSPLFLGRVTDPTA
ncbi:MAG: serpin family protein [Myxococcales bacterium]|nr:serpin family protein [Myxococcales bacterium]